MAIVSQADGPGFERAIDSYFGEDLLDLVIDDAPVVEGHCDAAFRLVKEAFVANFTGLREVGASVAVSVGGRTVVDLWGGSADSEGRPWSRDTLVDVFSVGKAMVALSLLVLIDRGQLDFDDEVAVHWPEFASAGKDSVTLSQLLSHQAGVPGIRRRLPTEAIYDWGVMTNALAAEEPWWVPGSAHGYHVNTFGFLGGEIVRRVSGTGFARFFETEVAGPLGADFHFGLSHTDQSRAAEFMFPGAGTVSGAGTVLAPGTVPGDDREDPLAIVYSNPPGVSGLGTVNSAAWRSAVHPSTNGHANARAIARIYELLASGGHLGDLRLVALDILEAATAEQVSGADLVLGRSSRFGFGFQLTQPERPLGPGGSGFGHFGAGGSLGMADPDAGLAFGYAMNRFGHRWQDPRNQALLSAVYSSL